MAERRMFSKKIVESARFIKMPFETQAFYFHLGMKADDDGVVEAFSVMRFTGTTEDSLKLLIAKGFVTLLNDDLVSHITDWNEHNLIRSDRKVDSIYKDLLLQVIPDISLIEKRERSDRHGVGQPMDVPLTTNGQRRIGKDRLGEDSIGKNRVSKVDKLLSDFKKIEPTYTDATLEYAKKFIEYRSEIKEPIKTARPIKLFINSLRECMKNGYHPDVVFEQMAMHEWQTVKLDWIQRELPKEKEWGE